MGQFLQGGKNGLPALQKLTHMQLLKGDSHKVHWWWCSSYHKQQGGCDLGLSVKSNRSLWFCIHQMLSPWRFVQNSHCLKDVDDDDFEKEIDESF